MTTDIAQFKINYHLTVRKSGHTSLFEQNPRHVELLLEHLELEETKVKGVGTPDEKSGTCHDETDFEKSKETLYRSRVVRFANFRAYSTCTILFKSIDTRNAQVHDTTLESTEKSYAVFEDTRRVDLPTPLSGADEFARHFRKCGLDE